MARADARTLLELVLVVLVEVADRLRLHRDLRGDLALDELLDADLVARVIAHVLQRHLLRGERLVELLLAGELPADLRDLRFDICVGYRDLARLGFLNEQLVADHVVEDAAIDAVALVSRHGAAGASLDALHRALEFSGVNRLAIDARDESLLPRIEELRSWLAASDVPG